MALEIMFVDALKRANPHLRFGGSKSIASCVHDMSAYTWLNDAIEDIIVYKSHEQGLIGKARRDLQDACRIISNMKSRRLYSFLGSVTLENDDDVDDVDVKAKEVMLQKEPELRSNDIVVKLVYAHCGSRKKNPLDAMYFFEKGSSDPVKFTEVSSHYQMPHKFQEAAIRVYCRDEAKTEAARRAFFAWSLETLGRSPRRDGSL
eukprot:CAMPEP_0170189482 /NCGR_PEP_ID=MMETSP0040_2-20121228/46944_1 /TAXON_ID=641309 /ORGANISM="Lotharella oceanica, Strain CCMP622" /LENGTH=203 /DNA_ID=CAMNT_0010437077 /DNA_START=321 /DNA_END=932 /DNA_ORIENTATION=-